MMNIGRYSKMSFTEVVSLPNYYIHELYKGYVVESIRRRKEEEEREKQKQAEEAAAKGRGNYPPVRQKDSADVSNLRNMLSNSGLTSSDMDDIEEALEDLR